MAAVLVKRHVINVWRVSKHWSNGLSTKVGLPWIVYNILFAEASFINISKN